MFVLFPLVVVLQLVSRQPTCPALSGDYVIQGQDGRVRVSIRQQGCTKFDISWNSTLSPGPVVKHAMVLDGAFRPDSGWYNGSEAQLTSAHFAKGVLEITEKSRGATASEPVSWTLRLEKLPNADLCARYSDGTINIPSLAARLATLTKAAEDAAAPRSENGCK